MKKVLLLAPLLLGYATAAATFPVFPAYDPFTDATARGGSSYAAGSTLAGQTNAMGQNWYGIYTSAGAATAITNTGYPLSYNNLPGFSGQSVLLRNVSGQGARMFFANSTPLNPGASGYYYSAVLVASNINSLSSAYGIRIMGFGTQGTLGDQSGQPSQGSTLWMKQVGTSPDFGFQFGLTASGNPGTATFYTDNSYATSQTYFIVVAVEGSDVASLWVNPDPGTFGALTEPAATFTTSPGGLKLSSLTCVQMLQTSNAAPDALYVSAFRMGTNWSWVTGGPAIGQQPLDSTNCPNGMLNLTATAMENGTPNGYRWQFNGVNLTDGPSPSGSGAIVSGSGTASLTITGMDTSAAQRDSGAYTVVVTNAYGSVTSSASAVAAHAAPVITTQPSPANLRLYAGASTTLSLTAAGFAPLFYYWYSNTTLVSATTSASFSIANAQASANFHCVVSNSVGTATSASVSLTVVPAPTSPYPVAVYNDHPISFWPLSEVPDDSAGNNGTVAFDYAGGNNGFYTNVYLGQQGYGAGLAAQYGYSPQTDTNSSVAFGSFSYYNSCVAQIPDINFAGSQASSFSVEAWANGNYFPQTDGATIVNKGSGGGEQFTLDYKSTGWRFYVRNAGGTLVTAASTNTIDANWHHLVGVVDTLRSNITIYVDGVARTVTSFTPSAGILSSSDPVLIGSRKSSAASTSYDDTFYGNIQEVALYNYALTAAQVASHYYAAGIGPSVTTPSSASVNEGATLTVAASAAGSSPLACQWYDVTLGSPGTALAGQTSATLLINNISAADYNGHSLALMVTNLFGQVTSTPYLNLQVFAGSPSSVAITPAALSAYAGAPLPTPFTVTAQGSQPFSYQWSTNGVPVPDATNATFAGITAQPGSYTVACRVSNTHGAGPLATASLTVSALPTDSYGSTVLRAGPIAFWRLDEAPNATIAYDYVGSHNATYTNAFNGQPGFSPTLIPWETATLFGSNGISPSVALEVNNTASGIPLIDFASQGANAQFSVEAWVQASPQSGGRDVVCKGYPNNTQFALDTGGNGGSFRFLIHTKGGGLNSVNSGSVLPDGQWHHLVGVCDEANGAIRIYADGSLKNSSSVTPGSGLLSLSGLYPVVIAAQQNQNGTSFTSISNACISQVAIYPYALPTSQVVSNYNAATYVAPPTISAVLSGTSLVITYTGTLVSATNVAGPFTNVVAGAVSPYTLPATNTQMFFRSRSTP